MRPLYMNEIELVSGGFYNENVVRIEPEIVVTASRSPFASFWADQVQNNVADIVGILGARWGIRGAIGGTAAGHLIEQSAGDLTYSALLAYENQWVNYYNNTGGGMYPYGPNPLP
jgi:hypothetical protein